MDNKEIEKLILGWVKWILDSDIKQISECDLCKNFENGLSKKIRNFLNSNEFKSIAYKFAENILNENEKHGKSIKEVLPKGFENSLKVLVYNKSPEIAASIKKYINGDKFRNMVKNEINKFLVGVNPMVAKFVNGKSVQTKIMNAINTYVDDTNNIMKIVMFVSDKIDETSNKSLREVLDYMPYEGKISLIRSTVDSILNLCNNEEFVQEVEQQIHNKVLTYGTIGNLLKSIGIKEDEILSIMQNSINKYLCSNI